jgi:hypothetical protein
LLFAKIKHGELPSTSSYTWKLKDFLVTPATTCFVAPKLQPNPKGKATSIRILHADALFYRKMLALPPILG